MLKVNADNLPRFMACNGSVNMAASAPPTIDDTTARDEGTAAHYMATSVYFRRATLDSLIDRKAPNGYVMSREMADHVDAYMSVIDHDGAMEIDTTHSHDPYWVIPGRTDWIKGAGAVLRVVDFKYGYRIREPQHNWTLISHALGYIKQQQFLPSRIELQIFQPRPFHPEGPLRKWEIDYPELIRLYQQLDMTLSHPSNMLRTSDHCGKCIALATCPAARHAEMNSIDASSVVFNDTIDNKHLSVILDNLRKASSVIDERLKAFEEMAKHRLMQGQVIDNYANQDGLGHSKFKEGWDAATIKAVTGIDVTKPGTVTPAEAKRRGVPENMIKAITFRPSTGMKLVRVDANTRATRLLNGNASR